jgi:hypothetical protein
MNSEENLELRRLASGIRAVSLIFTLVLSYFNFRLAFQIDHYRIIFSDMLGGKPLPGLTEFVIQAKPFLILSSLALPLVALVVIYRIRNHQHALYTLAGIMGALFIQIHITWTGLFTPLLSIINSLSEGP